MAFDDATLVYRDRHRRALAERGLEDLPSEREAELALHLFWPPAQPVAFPLEVADVTLAVLVNSGRWLVQCPNCMGAQYASRTDLRFFCLDCFNAYPPVNGRWVRIVWPDNSAAIERELEHRSDPKTRHWLPGESIAALKRQRAERGE